MIDEYEDFYRRIKAASELTYEDMQKRFKTSTNPPPNIDLIRRRTYASLVGNMKISTEISIQILLAGMNFEELGAVGPFLLTTLYEFVERIALIAMVPGPECGTELLLLQSKQYAAVAETTRASILARCLEIPGFREDWVVPYLANCLFEDLHRFVVEVIVLFCEYPVQMVGGRSKLKEEKMMKKNQRR